MSIHSIHMKKNDELTWCRKKDDSVANEWSAVTCRACLRDAIDWHRSQLQEVLCQLEVMGSPRKF